MVWLLLAIGLAIFWLPPIAALVGGRVANALVLLTPVAIAASIAWIKACRLFLSAGGIGRLSFSVKLAAVMSAVMMIAWAGLAISIEQSFATVFVAFIGWTIVIAISPLGVWWYNRISKMIPKADQPGQSMADWLDELPRDE